MTATLFSRLGGTEGVTQIASDLVDNHIVHPLLAPRFAGADISRMKRMAADFFSLGSGGPPVYAGKDMLSVHKGMNISDIEYMATIDDLMAALTASGVGDREKAEVMYIFYQLRPDVVGV